MNQQRQRFIVHVTDESPQGRVASLQNESDPGTTAFGIEAITAPCFQIHQVGDLLVGSEAEDRYGVDRTHLADREVEICRWEASHQTHRAAARGESA